MGRYLDMIDNPAGGRRLWNTGSAEKRTEAFLKEFTRALELTPEQITTIRPIVEDTMKQYIRYDREHLRLRKVAHDRAVEDIRPHLEPAQQAKLDDLNSSSQKRFGRAFRGVDGGE